MMDPHLMAASLESLHWFMCHVRDSGMENPSILDMGVGASSWVFRHYFDEVISVEPFGCEGYLWAVRNSVEKHEENGAADKSRFVLDLESVPACDFGFYDYLHQEDRAQFIELAWSKCRCGMYLDDCDDRNPDSPLRAAALAFAEEHQDDIACVEARSAADAHGRWGLYYMRA